MRSNCLSAPIVIAAMLIGAQVAPGMAQAQAEAQIPVPTPTLPAAAPVASWATDLLLDHRARRTGDLVTVQILESISAVGSADSTTGKSSSSGGGLPWPIPTDWSKALSASTKTTFSGAGTTSRAASITAVMTARVKERLPNGDLMIEGVREIVINGDRQFITLTGVIRPVDIANGNIVPSPFVGDLQIRYYGQGFMKDNLSPGWLIRFLNKIF
jgi:flagellar L-ring protein precursor FlgH